MGLRLAVFDLDGVLVDIDSSWVYLHERFGVRSPYMRLYVTGDIGYAKFMELDITLWVKAGIESLDRVVEELGRVKVRSGAYEAVRVLRGSGIEPAILSCGVDLLAERVARELGVRLWVANGLEVSGRRLTGKGVPRVPLLDKDKALLAWLTTLGYEPQEVAYVGDSEFDVPVFKLVGYSVALTDDPAVGSQAHAWLPGGSPLDAARLIVARSRSP